MKYVSVDIETTGLDINQDQILEIGAVYDNGIDNVQDLPHFRCIYKLDRITGSPYALSMHSELLKEIANTKNKIEPMKDFHTWLDTLGEKRMSIAGKNAANFDLPFLIRHGFSFPYCHRIIDVGSMYITDFGFIPSLDEINQFIEYKPVTHRALDDAINVVIAIRKKIGA